MKEKPYKVLVRLPPEMRDLLAQSARHYRRSMNSDIVARLYESFRGIADATREQGLAPPMHDQFEQLFRADLSPEEQSLVKAFRRLNKDQQLALLALLN
ncbi:MAG: Arc family DNA-binding protein [Pseudomonadales bacterium]|nr:Arc family DNA-binding protein [Pseudomonadales bacterium]NIX08976.1 Arc family DNA-binding protein [Pseudomonadales bacterium]